MIWLIIGYLVGVMLTLVGMPVLLARFDEEFTVDSKETQE